MDNSKDTPSKQPVVLLKPLNSKLAQKPVQETHKMTKTKTNILPVLPIQHAKTTLTEKDRPPNAQGARKFFTKSDEKSGSKFFQRVPIEKKIKQNNVMVIDQLAYVSHESNSYKAATK